MQLWRLAVALASGLPEAPFLHRPGASPDADLSRGHILAERGARVGVLAADDDEPRTVFHAKSGQIPAVPVSLKCVMDLTLQYFFVYTFLAVIVTYQDLRLGARTSVVSGLKRALTHACATVNAAPMLALLFLTVEMRAAFVGSTHLSSWVTAWMSVGTSAIALQTLTVLLLPAVTGELVECDDDGHMKSPHVPYTVTAKLVVCVRYATLALLYTSVCVVLYALLSLEGLHPAPSPPPMALPLKANVNLCTQYFCVALAAVGVRTAADLEDRGGQPSPFIGKAVAAMQVAFSTVSMAPMLAVVFMLARLRALQLDPEQGQMPAWTDWCFYGGTYALLAQTVLVVVCAACGGETVKGRVEGDFGIAQISPSLYYPLTAARYCAMLCMYASVVGLFVATANLTAASGATPAVSVTAHNTFMLAGMFFAVYLSQYLLNNLRDMFSHRQTQDASMGNFQLTRVEPHLHQKHQELVWIKWIKTIENARCTVQVCPMLAVLFLAVRARALQVTGGLGGPQPWAQDAMWVCTNSVLVQLSMVLVVAMLIDNIPQTNAAGQVSSEPSTPWLRVPLTIIRYLAFLGLYGGLVAVLVSVYVLTPERASVVQ